MNLESMSKEDLIEMIKTKPFDDKIIAKDKRQNEFIWEETITLDHPIVVSGETKKELKIRHPKVRDVEIANKSKTEMESSIILASNLTMLSPDEIRDMPIKDFLKIREKINHFLGLSPSQAEND